MVPDYLFAEGEGFFVFFRLTFSRFFPGRDLLVACPFLPTWRVVLVPLDAIWSSLSSMLSDSRSSVSSSVSSSSSSSSSSSTGRTSGEASASLSCITASPPSPSVLLLKADTSGSVCDIYVMKRVQIASEKYHQHQRDTNIKRRGVTARRPTILVTRLRTEWPKSASPVGNEKEVRRSLQETP